MFGSRISFGSSLRFKPISSVSFGSQSGKAVVSSDDCRTLARSKPFGQSFMPLFVNLIQSVLGL
ncbi:hypothetical protein Hanom_Chr00s000486g01645901 [Helianthus anomalus]